MTTRIFIILGLLFLATGSFAQNRVKFELFSIKKDTTGYDYQLFPNLVKPKTITMVLNPISKIEELGLLNGYVLGIQFETLKSGLEKEHLLFGMALYQKRPGTNKWEALPETMHFPLQDEKAELSKKGILEYGWVFSLLEDQQHYIINYKAYIN